MNESRPLISAIIPTYQHGETVGLCIDSLLDQTYPYIEIIVVNDGSTDNTKEVLKSFKDKITIIHQENRGGQRTRNRGFETSKGSFVIFIDADLRARPDMIEKMHEMLKAHPESSYAYSAFRFGWKKFRSFPFSKDRLREFNFIHTSTLIRREDFPGFDEDIKKFQDWDVWLTMLAKGKTGVYIPDVLFQLAEVHGREGISHWTPSFMYKIPWKFLPWTPKKIRTYFKARDILYKKHGIKI